MLWAPAFLSLMICGVMSVSLLSNVSSRDRREPVLLETALQLAAAGDAPAAGPGQQPDLGVAELLHHGVDHEVGLAGAVHADPEQVVVPALLVRVVLGDRGGVGRRADHRHLQGVVDDRRDRQHRGAVGRADRWPTTFSRSTSSRYCATVFTGLCSSSREIEHELAALDAALRIDLVDRDLGAALDLDADERGRPAQRAGKADLDRLLRVRRRPVPNDAATTAAASRIPHAVAVITTSILLSTRRQRPTCCRLPFLRPADRPSAAAACCPPTAAPPRSAAAARKMSVSRSALRDDLQADRQAVAGEAAGHRSGRQAAQIERIGVGHPGDDVLALELDRHVAADIEGRRRRRRRHQQIEALEELRAPSRGTRSGRRRARNIRRCVWSSACLQHARPRRDRSGRAARPAAS